MVIHQFISGDNIMSNKDIVDELINNIRDNVDKDVEVVNIYI